MARFESEGLVTPTSPKLRKRRTHPNGRFFPMDRRNFQVFTAGQLLQDQEPNSLWRELKDTCRNYTSAYDAVVVGLAGDQIIVENAPIRLRR